MGSVLDLEMLQQKRKELSSPPQASLIQVVKSDKSRTVPETLWRLAMAMRGPGKLSMGEYIKYNSAGVSLPQLMRFAGVAVQSDLHAACNDREWFSITKNKLTFELLMQGAGLPVARTLAVYDRKGRGEGAPVLTNATQLEKFLSRRSAYPLFCKPVTGVYSLGAFVLNKLEGSNVTINGSESRPVSQVVEFICDYKSKGYLFQEQLVPDGSTAKLTGSSGTVSLRFFVLLDGQEPPIAACIAKLPGADEVADNFWRSGAVLCAVDTVSGKIVRATMNADAGINVITRHPGTDQDLLGYQFRDFPAASNLVKKASRLLPGIRTQAWDVAITRTGPKLLEVNFGGDLSLAQISHGEGILMRRYCRHLRNSGYTGNLPH